MNLPESFKEIMTQTEGAGPFRYRLFSPEGKEGGNYPLLVCLHSENERGEDNRLQLTGLPCALFFAGDGRQQKHPCYVLAPQCPKGALWCDEAIESALVETVRRVAAEYAVDASRIYLHGVSMGAMEAYRLIARHPYLFAAALPVGGFGDPHEAAAAKFVPVWAFHAAEDPVISVSGETVMEGRRFLSGSRNMVAALRAAGNTMVKYTELKPDEALPGPKNVCEAVCRDDRVTDWLFEQDRRTKYEVSWIKPGVYLIDDYSDASCYLIEGAEKALLIDTGWGVGPFREIVASLTPLPVELAVTHAHGDHFLHADEFDVVYMHKKDIEILPQMARMFADRMEGHALDAKRFTPVEEGSRIDLGGGTVVTVLEVFGHTPGSVAYVDRSHNVIATGDAIGSGSGVWMQVPFATPIMEYRSSLERFSAKLKELGQITFLGGHRQQDGSVKNSPLSFGRPFYNPLNPQTVDDMIALCDRLAAGETQGERYPVSFGDEQAYIAHYKSAAMVYLKSGLPG